MIQNDTELTGNILILWDPWDPGLISYQNTSELIWVNSASPLTPVVLATQECGGVFLKAAPNRVSFSVNFHHATVLPELVLFRANDRVTWFSGLRGRAVRRKQKIFPVQHLWDHWYSDTKREWVNSREEFMVSCSCNSFVLVWFKSLPQKNHFLNTEHAFCPWTHMLLLFIAVHRLPEHIHSPRYCLARSTKPFKKPTDHLRLQGDTSMYFC